MCIVIPGIVNPNLFSSSVQQLLAAIHTQNDRSPALSPSATHHHLHHHHQQTQPQPQPQQSNVASHSRRHSSQSPPPIKQARVQTPKNSPLRCNSTASYAHHKYEKASNSSGGGAGSNSQQHSPANYSAQHLTNGHVSSGPSTPHHHHHHHHPHHSSSSSSAPSLSGGGGGNGSGSATGRSTPAHIGGSNHGNNSGSSVSGHHREQSPSAIAINSINR